MKLLSIATRDFVDFVNRKTVYANQSARSFIKNRTGNSTKCCGFVITLPLQNQAKNGLTFLYACGKIYTVVVSLQWEGGIHMVAVIIITIIALLLINSDGKKDRNQLIANLIALADMGTLAWLIAH